MSKSGKKSKKRSTGAKKFEWQECDKCGCVMNSKYFDQHRIHWGLNYAEIKAKILEKLLSDLSTTEGFFIAQKYFTTISETSSKIFKELKYLPNSVVILHPVILQRLNLKRNDDVLLCNSSNDRAIAFVWPSKSVRIGNIAIHPEFSKSFISSEKEWVLMEPYRIPKLRAESITLKIVDNAIAAVDDMISLELDLRFQIDEKYFTVGNKLIINHLRTNYVFIINEITEKILPIDESFTFDFEDITINDSQNFNVSQLSENMSNLTIRDPSELNSTYEFDSQIESVPTIYDNDHEDLPKFYLVTTDTKIIFENNCLSKFDPDFPITLIGGLKTQKKKLETLLHIKQNSDFNFTGVILHGLQGTGKTSLVKMLASTSDFSLILLHISTIFSKQLEVNDYLDNLFTEAKLTAPSIIFIDKLDLLNSNQHKLQNDMELITIKQSLIMHLDELLKSKEKVIILAETNNINEIDPDFRRQGRFDQEIRFDAPNEDERHDILNTMLKDIHHNLEEKDIVTIAKETHAFVGSDLEILCSRAKLHAINCSEDILTLDDFKFALQKISPSGMRGLELKVPDVFWSDIAIKEETRNMLEQIIVWPVKKLHMFQNLDIVNRNALLYGPPGCSKTLIAKALATETGLNFIAVKSSELISKYFGDSEHAINNLFAKARSTAPSIIFFDEFDGLAMKNMNAEIDTASLKIRTQLAIEFDKTKASDNIAILAATNRPDLIDDAFLSAARLGTKIYIPLPDESIRCQIFKIAFRKMPIDDNVNIKDLSYKTEKYSGAEVVQLCYNAGRIALRENGDVKGVIKAEHFNLAMQTVKPKISDGLIKQNELYFQTTKNRNYLAYM